MYKTNDSIGQKTALLIWYVDQACTIKEILLSMLTSDRCDALSPTELIFDKLSNIGPDTNTEPLW